MASQDRKCMGYFHINLLFKKKLDSLHARLNKHCKAWKYKKKKHKKIKAYRKSVWKESAVKNAC